MVLWGFLKHGLASTFLLISTEYLICSLAPISHFTYLASHHPTTFTLHIRHQPLSISETQRDLWATLFIPLPIRRLVSSLWSSRLPPVPLPPVLLDAPQLLYAPDAVVAHFRRLFYSRHSNIWLPQPYSPIRTSLVYRALSP
ncbi:hypothetical protein GGR53DRAFT_186178 [Hypoxylon sp. FL1150]|nr:hypothetical protein GGR53DRAFT_186178 [Hypoxylon sp. FL1150]